MNDKKAYLKELFHGLQKQMVAQLNTNREFIGHPGSKGDSLENVWIDWLRMYLPNRYSVDKAFVIDSNGELSDQIDLVIYDQQYTPFVFNQNGIKYIPAEGVYAVFEVKPDINGYVKEDSYVQYAGKKIESVRRLERTTVGIINAGQPVPARGLTKILGGILTISNSYTHRNNETIEKHLSALTGLQSIEIGCIIDYGSFYVDYNGDDRKMMQNDEIRRYYKDRKLNKIVFSTSENSLITFFLQLTRYLQQAIGTVPAINLDAYAKAVDFDIDETI